MSGWGVSEGASDRERIKSDCESYLRGLNCTGEINYGVYCDIYNKVEGLLDRCMS